MAILTRQPKSLCETIVIGKHALVLVCLRLIFFKAGMHDLSQKMVCKSSARMQKK
ncbi:MAG: hypothetical protein NVS9B13_05550 [Candidatus Acidiferrum sp.]